MGQKFGEKLGIRAKNLPIQKKKRKRLLGPKNKLGLSLSRKNGFFGPKIGKIFGIKVQKLPNFKEKKGLFRTKKKSLGTKRGFVGQKFGKTLRIRSRN